MRGRGRRGDGSVWDLPEMWFLYGYVIGYVVGWAWFA